MVKIFTLGKWSHNTTNDQENNAGDGIPQFTTGLVLVEDEDTTQSGDHNVQLSEDEGGRNTQPATSEDVG